MRVARADVARARVARIHAAATRADVDGTCVARAHAGGPDLRADAGSLRARVRLR